MVLTWTTHTETDNIGFEVEPGLQAFRLKQIDFDGAFEYSSVIERLVEVPDGHLLSDAYPNPFNPSTSFTLMLSREQQVRLEVFIEIGQLVDVVHNGVLTADERHTFTFESGDLP